MISIDTNVLLYAANRDCEEHRRARGFLEDCNRRDDVAIAELVLVELYVLLRNPAVVGRPLTARAASEHCQAYRSHPKWALIESADVMTQVWALASKADAPRRQIFDSRLAFTLRAHGVSEFATRNVRDFTDFGFEAVLDPIS